MKCDKLRENWRGDSLMKKLLAAAVAAAALSAAPALAIDMPVKAPVYKAAPAPMFNWTGFYVGGHVGYGWAFPEITESTTGTPVGNPPRPRGILGGAQLGYNWQAGNWVYGLESDITWSRVAGSSICVVPGGTLNCRGEPDLYSTVTGRIGYAADRSLYYVKGGAAWMSEGFRHLSITIPTCVGTPCTGSNSTWGWTIGAGGEYAFAPNWTLRLEYDFLDFGNKEHVTVTNGVSADNFELTRTFHLIKLGLNYKFGDLGKGPVSAKY